MKHVDEGDKCVGCGACQEACPNKCISLFPNREGFLYPRINEDTCVACGKCISVCPLHQEKLCSPVLSVVGARAEDENLVKQSSSGGIFSVLAQYVINEGGVVYGASSDFEEVGRIKVRHERVKNNNELAKLRGSKYVQSDLRGIYAKVKTDLDSNIQVLFSGTPCQINGLCSFLGKEYDNLILVDIICHGAPSPKVLQKYIESFDEAITGIQFRSKRKGWRHYNIELYSGEKLIYSNDRFHDLYLRAFIGGLFLRPSCYACSFKGHNRKADITLADFWSVGSVIPEIDHDEGVSLVAIHSPVGERIFEKCSYMMQVFPLDSTDIISDNFSYSKSENPHRNREKFMNDLDSVEVVQNIKRCLFWDPATTFVKRVFLKIKKTFHFS